MLKVTENRLDVFRAIGADKRLSQVIHVGAGDLVKPLVLEALKRVPLQRERNGDLDEHQGGLQPGTVRLPPDAGQGACQGGPDLRLTALAL